MKLLRKLRRWFKRKFGLARLVCLALLVAFAALRVADPAPIEELRVRTFDGFQRIQPRTKMAKSPVVIVDIDDRSLAKFGQWPWPRTRIADLVAGLARLGAVAIGFDILFPEPDRLNPDIAADTFHGLDEETREKLRGLPSNDQVLADTMRRTRVILGETGLPKVVAELDKTLPVTGFAVLGGELGGHIYEFAGLLRNTPVLEAAAAGRGLLTINPERDGIIRRVPMITMAQDETMPALSAEILRVVTGTDTIFVKTDHVGIKSVAVKGLEVPTDRNG
ncbi:MAG TPA: CHASE2 domain-containing protein, partial [Bradyrhizobium sp.]|nr:CHASE2 domain-containing protein [Bradyrhizobium sp.]